MMMKSEDELNEMNDHERVSKQRKEGTKGL